MTTGLVSWGTEILKQHVTLFSTNGRGKEGQTSKRSRRFRTRQVRGPSGSRYLNYRESLCHELITVHPYIYGDEGEGNTNYWDHTQNVTMGLKGSFNFRLPVYDICRTFLWELFIKDPNRGFMWRHKKRFADEDPLDFVCVNIKVWLNTVKKYVRIIIQELQ